MRNSALGFSIVLSLAVAACGKKPAPPTQPSPVPTATAPTIDSADASATAEDAAAPEDAGPVILPPNEREANEKWDSFIAEGKKFLRSMSTERYEIIVQLREIKFEEETEKWKEEVKKLADKLQDFELGDTPETLETGVDRMCALIDEVRPEAEKLIAEGQADLEKVSADLKVIDDKLAAKEKVSQREIDKLEKLQQRLSGPPLAGRYVLLTIKSLLDEGMVIVDYGVQRARRKLHACLTKLNEKPFDLELTQKNLENVLRRATKLLAIPQ